MIFSTLNPEKIWHESLTGLFTSPVRCSRFTLGNLKKLFSTVLFMHTSHYLCNFTHTHTHTRLMALMLFQKKTNCNPLAHPTWKCHHTNFWIAKLFFIWLKVFCILSSIGGYGESQLWIVVCCSEKNRLWCVATGMSGKQCHSKCSEWPLCALIHVSNLFRHCTVT